ncbi:MAG TPA: DUF2235 domain-containing protein [Cyanobacteria bacterium UBA11162]|nr:DUF2235 domain-containing protein [Cyanobacteria bacterium UBA11370]HBL14262.1 DUF2235 domain-containing protein [Cyanobacteria bacterium UBA11162]
MKRLIVCCDGTWQDLTSPCPSNVVRIAQAIKPIADDGTPQIVFYDEGIGTEAKSNKIAGGVTGRGIDKNIEDGYRFLCFNYTPGDEIYLFGFSRGAYTVRSLAGMIYCSGLLTRAHICKAPSAYKLYRNRDIKPRDKEAVEYRKSYGEQVPITLLGCFDTVGSLGLPDLSAWSDFDKQLNKKYAFHDTTLSPIVQNALHACAIDEVRKTFQVTPMKKHPNVEGQRVREVWFPGGHGCVGGGTESYRGLSDAALQWMMDSIGDLGLGLEFDPNAIEDGIKPKYDCDFDNDPGFFKLGGLTVREVSEKFEDLHESVIHRWRNRKDYRPKNLEKHLAKLNLK